MSPYLKNVSFTKVERNIFGSVYQIFKTMIMNRLLGTLYT